jgi:hypothetical protein
MDSLQNEPRFTPVTGNGHAAEIPRKRFDPTRIFVEKDRLTWFWFGFAMLVLVGSAVDRIYLVQSFKQRERVIVVDPASTFYVSPLLKFSEAKELHAQQSTLAAVAFLQRNPKGFDNDELLKQMFLKHAPPRSRSSRPSSFIRKSRSARWTCSIPARMSFSPKSPASLSAAGSSRTGRSPKSFRSSCCSASSETRTWCRTGDFPRR